jgi:hypothetical protein
MDAIESALKELNEITKKLRPETDYRNCVNCVHGSINRTRYGQLIVICKREDPEAYNGKFIAKVEPRSLIQKNARYSFKNKEIISEDYFMRKCNLYKQGNFNENFLRMYL